MGLIGEKTKDGEKGLTYDYFLGKDAKTFTYYSNKSAFTKLPFSFQYPTEYDTDGTPIKFKNVDFSYNSYSKNFTEKGVELKVKLILQKKKEISYGCLESGFYYTKALTDYVLDLEQNVETRSSVVKFINDNGNLELVPYSYKYSYWKNGELFTQDGASIIMSSDSSSIMGMIMSGFGSGGGSSSLDTSVTSAMLGGSTLPTSIYIYPVDFDNKNLVTDYLDGWNDLCETVGGSYNGTALEEKDKITYADTVGMIISMVNTMIQMITIALSAFTALSLVVSTVMVGIITYVSVVERVKEIGILRAVGARKKDIKRLFNAETFIIGLSAGAVGILITYLLSLIVNVIVGSLTGIYTIAALPVWQALVMICVSITLTLISGLIPAAAAAKKDPVVALRTE